MMKKSPFGLKLKHAIAKLVRRITIFPDGLQGGLPRYGDNNEGIVVERYEESESYKRYPDLMEVMRHEYDEKTTGRNNAAFIVTFRNGHSRLSNGMRTTGGLRKKWLMPLVNNTSESRLKTGQRSMSLRRRRQDFCWRKSNLNGRDHRRHSPLFFRIAG
jgi:hypothetical protein